LRFLNLRYFFRSEGVGKAVFPALKGRNKARCFALLGLVTCHRSQTQGDALG
jgi:hypothetical protein